MSNPPRRSLRPLLVAVACVGGIGASWSVALELAASAGISQESRSRVSAKDSSRATDRQSASEASGVQGLVAAAISGDYARLEQIVVQLRSQAKSIGGDRRVARQLNEEGLALWQRQRFSEAASLFRQAHQANPGDAEIRENLGYALLMSGALAQAEPAILAALEVGPERATAWGSLGIIYAKQGKHREAVACVLTAYRFAPNPKRTLDVYSRQATTYDDPKVRALMADVVTRLSTTQKN